jgi:mevalonate kinase
MRQTSFVNSRLMCKHDDLIDMTTFTTTAPAKAILFGEHAVNRGQAALAVSVGLHARCELEVAGDAFCFEGAGHWQHALRDEILALRRNVDAWREAQDYNRIRMLARDDFFAPQKYILAHAYGDALPQGMHIRFESEIPPSSGLGSGGATFAALAKAIAKSAPLTLPLSPRERERAIGQWAWLGDVIAHGGIASALDTQTSLLGSAIRYTQNEWGRRVPCHASLALVIGHCGVSAATSEVNTRVREWLAADATRMRYFEMIGMLSDAAQERLAIGDWKEMGKLVNMNQLVLEKIGVSCPELERLIDAALKAGALGAKLSGSGGGGIMIALVTPETKMAVAKALHDAGAQFVYTPQVAVGENE